jgi:hypothetical protein
MTGSSRRRVGRGRLAIAGAFAALGVMAFGASSAQAISQNFTVTLDDAILSLPAPAGNSDILDPPDVATIDGSVDDTTHALNVLNTDFVFPGFDGSLSGIPLHVEFGALDNITGTLDTSGNMTTNPSTYQTVVALGTPLNASCTYQSEESFKTSSGTPFNGDPFTETGTSPITLSDGIIQTQWGAGHFSLTANTGDCSLVTNIINSGCGGLAIADNLTPTPGNCNPPSGGGGTTTPPPATTPTKKKKCKKAKKRSASVAKKKCKKKK